MQLTRTGISSFGLKLAAIIAMTANHVAHAFIAQLPVLVSEVLYWLGGITFPVMAFLIVEGYRHTSSVPHYLGRLLAFAVLSQVPFTLLFGWTANIFFTLAIGLAVIWIWDRMPSRAVGGAALIAGMALSLLCDWAVLGPLMIFAFHVLRSHPRRLLLTMAIPYATMLIPAALTLVEAMVANAAAGQASAGNAIGFLLSAERFLDATHMAGLPMEFANTLMMQVCQLGYGLVGFTLACLLIGAYNGQRGPGLKWAFYAYYPLHLLIIWLVKSACVII